MSISTPTPYDSLHDGLRIGHYFIIGYGGYKCIQAVPGVYLARPHGDWLVAVPEGHRLRVVGTLLDVTQGMMELDEYLARRGQIRHD